jgi:hypothetical protein
MNRLEDWVHRYPKTCAYLIAITSLNFALTLLDALGVV